MNIKLRPADIKFSRLLRLKIKHCEKCLRSGVGKERIEGLQCSHFHGRRNENTRFSFENCDVLCFFCHQHFTENPNEYVEWKKSKLGEERFKLLELEANQYKKKDDKLTLLWIKQELERLN